MSAQPWLSVNPAAKHCPDCNQTMPVSEFHRRRTSRDGRQVYCKVCMARRVRQSVAKHPDEARRHKAQTKAYNRAESRLREAHRSEFNYLYAQEIEALYLAGETEQEDAQPEAEIA